MWTSLGGEGESQLRYLKTKYQTKPKKVQFISFPTVVWGLSVPGWEMIGHCPEEVSWVMCGGGNISQSPAGALSNIKYCPQTKKIFLKLTLHSRLSGAIFIIS